jgi:uncharacterized membrane protein required for colicin V production
MVIGPNGFSGFILFITSKFVDINSFYFGSLTYRAIAPQINAILKTIGFGTANSNLILRH